ncbi:NADPH-dependent FMN reductase [Nocardia sp. NPDC127526]|uniref:NADPH-dependent FMN reductase n=1 Tax=Nocardia sp. NPDC127526 TaxID=3345393 RepID=UPI0036378227
MSTTTPLRLAVIVASTRDGRFGPTVANWFTARATEHAGFQLDVIDVADHPLPAVLSAHPDPAFHPLRERLGAADAVVVVTPEYNHSYPASLKTLIDWHYEEWRLKPIGFVSYGGMAGGLRAVEHLRQVFAELHAVTVRDTVSFHVAWDRFDNDGNALDPDSAIAAKTMLDQLLWWAYTLRNGRAARPYTH